MRNIIYCAQFHDQTGYSVAALGYLKSLDKVLPNDINLKIYSVSIKDSTFSNFPLTQEERALVKKYHLKDDDELAAIIEQGYDCIWHMTTVLPFISKSRKINYKNCTHNLYEIIKNSQKNYHLLVWETNKMPQEWREAISHLKPEKIITASKWNQDCFSEVIETELVPHLVETTISSKKIDKKFKNINFKNKFIVFSLSEWNNRKNHENLIASFVAELGNKDDALLILKTSSPPGTDPKQIPETIKSIKSAVRVKDQKSNIILITDFLEEEELNFLYKNCSIFALTSKGEGFSLPTSEAIRHKKPVLVPMYGGHIDYISSTNPFFVEGMWDTVMGAPPYDIDGEWYIPSISSTRKNLKKAYDLWLDNPDKLNKIGNENFSFLKKSNLDRGSIGTKFLKALEIQDKHYSLPKKKKISILKSSIKKATSLEKKVEVLRDSFKGEDCYILNCGPSINQYSKEFLNKFLSDKLVLSMKQSYDLFPDVTDFHFFNCSNLPLPKEEYFKTHYRYNDDDVISIASSNYEKGARWYSLQHSDLFFKVPIRTEINNEFLVRTKKIDDNLLSNKIERPCGPGIMLETGLFLAFHLGVKNIYSIGWDLTSKKVNEDTYPHFYGNTEKTINRGDIMSWEIEEARSFSKDIYSWCKNNDIGFFICSSPSSLDENIPRIDLKNGV